MAFCTQQLGTERRNLILQCPQGLFVVVVLAGECAKFSRGPTLNDKQSARLQD